MESEETPAPAGTGPGSPTPPNRWWGGGKGQCTPRPIVLAPRLPNAPRLPRRSSVWRFVCLGSFGPNAEEWRVPSTLTGAVHRRDAGGPEVRRAWGAGWARANPPKKTP